MFTYVISIVVALTTASLLLLLRFLLVDGASECRTRRVWLLREIYGASDGPEQRHLIASLTVDEKCAVTKEQVRKT
ncbi:MAG TPA: hypothetical protein VNQ79_18805 [Blastocatellia bacterium]|nr:hypothetical protein [Blastocatellia bacterium]